MTCSGSVGGVQEPSGLLACLPTGYHPCSCLLPHSPASHVPLYWRAMPYRCMHSLLSLTPCPHSVPPPSAPHRAPAPGPRPSASHRAPAPGPHPAPPPRAPTPCPHTVPPHRAPTPCPNPSAPAPAPLTRHAHEHADAAVRVCGVHDVAAALVAAAAAHAAAVHAQQACEGGAAGGQRAGAGGHAQLRVVHHDLTEEGELQGCWKANLVQRSVAR